MKTCDHGMPILGIVQTCPTCIDRDNRGALGRRRYLDTTNVALAAIGSGGRRRKTIWSRGSDAERKWDAVIGEKGGMQ